MSLSLREAALQALSAIEDSGHRYHLMAAADALRAALAEAPKAEPETGTYLDQIAEAKRDMEQWPGWMKDAATIGAAAPPKTEPVALSDEAIIAIRDEHLPAQGEPLDCVAFARAVLAHGRKG